MTLLFSFLNANAENPNRILFFRDTGIKTCQDSCVWPLKNRFLTVLLLGLLSVIKDMVRKGFS